jgi:hypothetical protein
LFAPAVGSFNRFEHLRIHGWRGAYDQLGWSNEEISRAIGLQARALYHASLLRLDRGFEALRPMGIAATVDDPPPRLRRSYCVNGPWSHGAVATSL